KISRKVASLPVVTQYIGPQRRPASFRTFTTMVSLVSPNRATNPSTADTSTRSTAAVRLTGRSTPRLSVLAIIENLLDRHLEKARDAEGQRQGGIVLAGLDRVDRLPRHVEPQGQFRLAPVAFGAQHLEAVVHIRLACLYVRFT